MATIDAIFRAVKIINSDAQMSITENDLDSIVWENGTTPISKSDIEAMMPTVEAEYNEKETDKASGKQKLKDLGLPAAEIKALTGA